MRRGSSEVLKLEFENAQKLVYSMNIWNGANSSKEFILSINMFHYNPVNSCKRGIFSGIIKFQLSMYMSYITYYLLGNHDFLKSQLKRYKWVQILILFSYSHSI